VRVWDLDRRQPRQRLVVRGLKRTPWWLALSPDGKTFAVGFEDNSIQLWDLNGDVARERAVLPGPADHPPIRTPAVRFSRDGKLLVVARAGFKSGFLADNTFQSITAHPDLHLWDLSLPAPRELTLPPQVASRSHDAVAFSPDGRLLAMSDTNHTLLWDLTSGSLRERGMLQKTGLDLAFSADGRTLLALADSIGGMVLRQWDLAGHRLTREMALKAQHDGRGRFGVSADGRTMAGADAEGRHLVVWSTASGERIGEYELPWPVRSLALAPDGRHLAVNNRNGTVYILRLAHSSEKSPQDFYRRGLWSTGRNDYDQAIAHFSDAIGLDRNYAAAYYQRGVAHAHRGNYAEAKKDLDQAFLLDPSVARSPASRK
jgi:WD40 repeat protein